MSRNKHQDVRIRVLDECLVFKKQIRNTVFTGIAERFVRLL